MIAAAMVGCRGPEDVTQTERRQRAVEPEAVTLAAVQAATEKVLAPVDPSALAKRARLDPTRLTATQLDRVRGADLPVLLPADLDTAQLVISRGPGWYAASYRLDNHTVLVSGSRITFVRPGARPQLAPERAGRIQRSRGIVELDLTTAGVSYTINVDCAQPTGDTRCTGDVYVSRLAASLALLPEGVLR